MKLAGAVLLTAAGLFAGLRAAGALRKRASDAEALCHLLERMLFELERFRTPLPELFSSLSESAGGAARAVCLAALRGMEEGKTPFSRVWAEACSPLSEPERERMEPLGAVLGSYGAPEQARALTAAWEDMRRLARRRREEVPAGARLYIGLLTAGGLLAAVLLF